MSAPTLFDIFGRRPWLVRLLKPMANWYVNAAGYRQMGLLADDLIPEEKEMVLKALSRLSPRESYDRIYRIRRANQLSLQHKILPRAEWTKPEQDVLYLTPILEMLEAEAKERKALDSLTVLKKH